MRLSDNVTNAVVLTWLIDHIVDYRNRKGYITMADKLPKIEIKGIAEDVTRFRTGVQTMRASIAKLHETRSGFHQDVVDVEEQLSNFRQDIRFELQTLGNSGGNSEAESDKEDVSPLTVDSTAAIESEH